MTAHRFDILLAALTTAPSRRSVVRALSGLGLAGLLGHTDAKKKRRKKKCAKAGQPTSKKRKKCCKGLVKDAEGRCARHCTPATCPASNCGTLPDGCGGMLSCGGCPTNQICLRSNVCQPCSIVCTGTPEQCGETLQQALEAGGGYYVCPGLYRRQLGFTPVDAVTLIGAGQGDDETSNTILESGGNTRVLTISGGISPVTLERLQIRNGRLLTTGGHIFGGAILLQQPSTLHMTECTVSRNNLVNLSQGDFAKGGGIAVEAGCTLEMTHCTVRENFATPTKSFGGGIWTAGTTTLTDCLVEANGAEPFGGGLLVEGGKTTLTGSTRVRLNTAASGAGINVITSELEVAATCRVTENTAPNGAGPGGISNLNGTVTLAGADPSPIVVNNCPDNCVNVPKCSTEPPVSCPP